MDRPRRATLFRQKGLWYVSFWLDGRRVRQSTGTANRKLAEEIRRAREQDMILGTLGLQREVSRGLFDPARREVLLAALHPANPVPVEPALREYLEQACTYKRPKTLAVDQGRLRRFFAAVAATHLHEVTPQKVADYLARRHRAEGCSPTTLLRDRETLHAFFEWARARRHVEANPVSEVPRPRPPERDIAYLKVREIEAVLRAVRGDLIEGAVATAIYAGLRREEICWLTWEDVDLDRRLLRVRSKTIEGESWAPKTRKNRTVPISEALLPFLAAEQLRRRSPLWVFPSPEGCRWDPDNLSRRLRVLLKRAGIRCGFLTFRHTFGSQLAQRGVSLFKIARLMGNSPPIAERHYAALCPEEMHQDVEFILPKDRAHRSAAEP